MSWRLISVDSRLSKFNELREYLDVNGNGELLSCDESKHYIYNLDWPTHLQSVHVEYTQKGIWMKITHCEQLEDVWFKRSEKIVR